MMKIVVIMVCDSGNRMLIKNLKGFVLLICVVFCSFFGIDMKNCWKKKVLVVDVNNGMIKLV